MQLQGLCQYPQEGAARSPRLSGQSANVFTIHDERLAIESALLVMQVWVYHMYKAIAQAPWASPVHQHSAKAGTQE